MSIYNYTDKYRKSSESFKRFPEILFRGLRSNSLCHTLIKVFDISKKTPFPSIPSSNDVYILEVIASKWLTQESPGRNPDWLGENNLLSVKKVNSPL